MKSASIIFLIGAVLFLGGKIGLGRKPPDTSLVNRMAKAPKQETLAENDPRAAPIYLKFEKQLYSLYPKANYAIEGLIVSQHRSDSFFDLAHAASKDTLNSRDICTVWGQTLTVGAYSDVEFWSGDWTCNYQYSSIETAAVFRPDEVSNTHVLAKDPSIRAKLASLEVGDEYKMAGRLVDYELAFGGRRNTSLVRTDTGDGACEVLFVESIEILKSHNRVFAFVQKVGFWTALLALVWIFGTMLKVIFLKRGSAALLFLALLSAGHEANARICDASSEYCGDWGGSSSSATSSASRGGKIRMNPAVLPVAKGFGAEFLYFDQSVDFALVKGLGRIGAAISPSNSEETFFGPPGFEFNADLLARKQGHHKFPSQKYTFATAFGLFNSGGGSSAKKFSLNLGVMAKLNRLDGTFTGGGGLSGIAGPFTFGYSRYSDHTVLESPAVFPSTLPNRTAFNYTVETFSLGAYIDFLAVDYSLLKVLADASTSDSTVTLLTATVLFKRALLTVAQRAEQIPRSTYNYDKNILEIVDRKIDYFGGFQYAVAEPLLLGLFYNYYLVRDLSVGATIFF